MGLQSSVVPIYQKQGRVWLQRTELNPYILLENHGLTGINWPAAAPTAIRAQSQMTRMGSRVIDVTQGDTDLPAFTIPTSVRRISNYLMSLEGERVGVQVLTGPDGDPTQYGSTKYGFGWVKAMRGSASTDALSNPTNAGDGVPATFETPFAAVMGPIPIDWSADLAKKSFPDTQSARDVFTLPVQKVEDVSRRVLAGQVGMIVCDGTSTTAANTYYFEDFLDTAPTSSTAVPVAAGTTGYGVSLTGVIGYGDKRTNRFFVCADHCTLGARGAYTDTQGSAWISSPLNTTSGDGARAAWIVNAGHAYACGGQSGADRVWHSVDGMATWDEYDPGENNELYDIQVMGNGVGYTVGAGNTIVKIDDWTSFTALTGPSAMNAVVAQAVGIKASTGTFFVGYADGCLYSSDDEGASWTDKSSTIQGITQTAITKIQFDETGEYGFMLLTNASGAIRLRTTDGGASWKAYSLGNSVSTAANYGMHTIATNDALFVGAIDSTYSCVLLVNSDFAGGSLR